MSKRLILITVFALFLAIPIQGSDWPQWRGPDRDGTWPEEGIIQKFEAPRLDIRWRAKIAK